MAESDQEWGEVKTRTKQASSSVGRRRNVSEMSGAVSEGRQGQRMRMARNEREQKRAHKISDLINNIKALLDQSSFPAHSTSKYDILKGCENLIRHLQKQAQCFMLEKKLRQAVLSSSWTELREGSPDGNNSDAASNDGSSNEGSNDGGNESGNGGNVLDVLGSALAGAQGPASSSDDGRGSALSKWGQTTNSASDSDNRSEDGGGAAPSQVVYVDYYELFMGSSCPMAIADGTGGHLVESNMAFQSLMQCSKEQALQMKVMNMVPPVCMQPMLKAIKEMNFDPNKAGLPYTAPLALLPDCVPRCMSVSVVRSKEGAARCLHLAVLQPAA
ncbi:unnamed protein product [Chrysoparadoxa australica]